MSERKDELTDLIKRGELVRRTVASEGWREVLLPALQDQRNLCVKQFQEQAKTFEDFVNVQQSLNAVDWLLNYINEIVAGAEIAEEELKKEV